MFKKINGFTLVEALVIMTVLAIVIASLTPVITRKALKASAPSVHGRYEAYIVPDNDGISCTAYQTYFNASGKEVKHNKCGSKFKCVDGPKDPCHFTPDPNTENFHIKVVGSGGAGGSAGGNGSVDGSGSAGKGGGADANGGKFVTNTTETATKKVPFSDYFDLRTYNEDNVEIATTKKGSTIKSSGGDDKFKVSVLEKINGVTPVPSNYAKFPAPTEWTSSLGSSQEKSEKIKVPNWFTWGSQSLSDADKIFGGIVASACSGSAGKGGDLFWSTLYDYDFLRSKYVSYDFSSNRTNGYVSGGYNCCGNGFNASGVCKGGWYRVTEKRTCKSSNTAYYECNTSNASFACDGSTASCSKTKSRCNSEVALSPYPSDFARRTSTVYDQDTKMFGLDGGASYKMGQGSLDTGDNSACVSVKQNIQKNLTASATLDYYSTTALNGTTLITPHKRAIKKSADGSNFNFTANAGDGRPANSCRNNYSGIGGPNSSDPGTTGTAKIEGVSPSKIAKANGGGAGKGACEEWKCDGTQGYEYNADGTVARCKGRWHCAYGFGIPGLKSYISPANRENMTAGCWGPVDPNNTYITSHRNQNVDGSKGDVGTVSGSLCFATPDGKYNYCRTGVYNYEYSWEMARGFKRLAYGDKGEPGKVEAKNVGQINGPVEISLGAGGRWKTDAWKEDKTSRGPSGKPTVVKGIITVDGGLGGEGARKTNTYELCSIHDRGRYANICTDKKIQEGVKGETSKLEPLKSNKAPQNPGKGGDGVGTISMREYVCNARVVYNLMATNNKPYDGSAKYNGYQIVPAFEQLKKSDPLLCADKDAVGNEYYLNDTTKGSKVTKETINKNNAGADGAVIITW